MPIPPRPLIALALWLGVLSPVFANPTEELRRLYQQAAYAKVLSRAEQMLPQLQTSTERRTAWHLVGLAQTRMGNYAQAIASLDTARQLAQSEAGAERDYGLILIDLGDVYERRKDHTQALLYYRQALGVLEQAKAWLEARRAWFQIGDIDIAAGRFETGMQAYAQGLQYAREANDPDAVAEALDYLGYAQRKLGDPEQALRHHSEALEQSARIRDSGLRQKALARARNHIGLVLQTLAQHALHKQDQQAAQRLLQQAIASEQQALQAARAAADMIRQGYVLRALTSLHSDLASLDPTSAQTQLSAALQYAEQALSLAEAQQHAEWIGLALHSIAVSQARLGKTEAARQRFEQAIRHWTSLNDSLSLGLAHRLLAREVAERDADLQTAHDHYRKAIAAFKRIRAADELAHSYFLQARLQQRRGEQAAAEQSFIAAIDTYESLRAQLHTPEHKQRFFAQRQAVYEAYLQLLWQKWQHSGNARDIEQAFLISERARGRTLLELLSGVSHTLHAGVDAQTLQRERELHTQHQDALIELRGARTVADFHRAEKHWRSIDKKRLRFERELQTRYPAYAYLRYPQPLNAAEVRRLLPSRTALIEYFIGEQYSFAFVLYHDRPTTMTALPIERADLHARITALRKPLTQVKTQGSLKPLGSLDTVILQSLYTQLFEPIAETVQDSQELIVVPHGPLFYLPLEMLVLDRQAKPPAAHLLGEFARPRYLLETAAPMRYALSASVLNPLLTRERRTPDARVLAFVDPHYDHPNYRKLPTAQREMQGLRGIYTKQLTVFESNAATKAQFIEHSPHYGTLIIGTHGVFDDTQPLRSGLVFAGDKQENSVLTSEDVFNLRLNAKLATFAACEIGLGYLQDGEGLIGLTRAWQYAGVKQLLVTLWSVEDATTVELSIGFHRRLTHASTAAALRDIKLELLQKHLPYGKGRVAQAHPFFWAGFVLY